MKIETFYNEFRGLLSQTPQDKDSHQIENSVVDSFNQSIDDLSKEIKQDLSRFKIDETSRWDSNRYLMIPFRTQLGKLIGFLEGEFNLIPEAGGRSSSGPNISVINQNTVAVTVNQSIQQIIDNAETDEEKEKLTELKSELEKPQKDWGKIRGILKWALDFSEKLFFQLLPILLKHYGSP